MRSKMCKASVRTNNYEPCVPGLRSVWLVLTHSSEFRWWEHWVVSFCLYDLTGWLVMQQVIDQEKSEMRRNGCVLILERDVGQSCRWIDHYSCSRDQMRTCWLLGLKFLHLYFPVRSSHSLVASTYYLLLVTKQTFFMSAASVNNYIILYSIVFREYRGN